MIQPHYNQVLLLCSHNQMWENNPLEQTSTKRLKVYIYSLIVALRTPTDAFALSPLTKHF
ncbi:hypothetical protein LFU01_37730 [Lysinibacillus fusiformis]|nr:hypothetical protein LFU01_37730 [Lysinibacillus fusiformis]